MVSLLDAAYMVNTYLLPILISCGFVLNMLSFLVMRRIKNSTTARYMSFLALTDTGVLIIGAINKWFTETSLVGCKLFPVLFYSFADYSVLIIVLMNGERLYAVWRPVQAKNLLKTHFYRIFLALAGFFCFSINSHFIFSHSVVIHELIIQETTAVSFTDLTSIRKNNKSYISQEVSVCEYVRFKEFYEYYWIFIDATIYSFLPFVLLTIFNILIIYTLKQADNMNWNLSSSYEISPRLSIVQYVSIYLIITFILLTILFDPEFSRKKIITLDSRNSSLNCSPTLFVNFILK